jgi:5-methylcytosine-specific restriction endonuclease McrA
MELETEDFWRALILFGKNASTYKMALGKCLLSYSKQNKDKITLDDLALDFYNLYVDRVKNKKPQGAVLGRKTYIEQEIEGVLYTGKSLEKALEVIKQKSLNDMVLKKFHNLNEQPIEIKFYTVSENTNTINLNKKLLELANYDSNQFFQKEIDSRWALLEHAFHNIHKIELLDADEYLKYVIHAEKRMPLTSLVNTLEGYQQGYCFYCGQNLYDIEVDHVIPYNAIKHNEIWNLVLSHSFCNQNKSDNVPSLHYIEKLITRNEFFIHSSHPIKDTLIRKLGNSEQQRRNEIIRQYQYAKNLIVRMWGGNDNYNPAEDDHFKRVVNYLGSRI